LAIKPEEEKGSIDNYRKIPTRGIETTNYWVKANRLNHDTLSDFFFFQIKMIH
jgi:hypothetical protein